MATRTAYDQGHFCWVDLMSHGMSQAKGFYGNLFGWKAEDQDTQGGPPYAMLKLEGKDAGGLGEASDEMKAQGVPPCWNSYIQVDDVEATVKKAQELGATVTVPPMKVVDAGWLAFIQDPTGGHVGLWQTGRHCGASVVNEAGALCWNELATRDIEKAKDFYGKLVGWDFSDHPAPTKYYICNVGGKPNGGLMEMNEECGDVPPHWGVYFAVADTDASAKRVEELGGKICIAPFDTPVGRVSVVSDPQGATFSLIRLGSEAGT